MWGALSQTLVIGTTKEVTFELKPIGVAFKTVPQHVMPRSIFIRPGQSRQQYLSLLPLLKSRSELPAIITCYITE